MIDRISKRTLNPMKEYILLIFIALIGFSGLINIHQDMKAQKESVMVLWQNSFLDKPIQVLPERAQAPWLQIDYVPNHSRVHFHLAGFDGNNQFYIDYGNGKTETISDAEFTYVYAEAGKYQVKLYRDEKLLEKNQLTIPGQDAVSMAY